MTKRTNTRGHGQRQQSAPQSAREELLQPANPGEDLLSPAEWAKAAADLGLTRRQVEVARLVGEGLSRKAIASRLRISVQTVRVHIDGLCEKLHVKGHVQLALRLARLHEHLGDTAPAAARTGKLGGPRRKK